MSGTRSFWATAWRGAFGALLLVLTLGGGVRAGEILQLASGPRDSASYAAGVGLSSLIKFKLLPTRRLDLQASESAGALDNVRRLQSGEAQFAILPATVGHAARIGAGSFAGDPPATGFRAIAALWRDALHLVMRADDVTTGTIDDLRRLEEGRVFPGDTSSGMADANRLLLDDLGLDPIAAMAHSATAVGDGPTAISQGEVDAISAAARPPTRGVASLFEDPSVGFRLLDVTEDQLAQANGNHWLWTPYVIPAATYPGQVEDVWTIALSNLLVVRADVDEDVVHDITENIFENLAYLRRVDPVMAELDLENALVGVTMPLHPGALRYYRAAGLITEPSTIPATGIPGEDEIFERYPDGDVAGDWPSGVGGPLLRNPPSPGMTTPPDLLLRNGQDWRRRATL